MPELETDNSSEIGRLRDQIADLRQALAAVEKARDAAVFANDAKTRYLVAVSHEIRSPLNAIYGYSQLLERGGVTEAQEAGRVIRRSSEHLGNLVEGLLDISRIESGVIRISRDTVPFLPLVEQLADMFRSQAAEKGVDLRLVTEGRMPAFVRTDEKRLRQIIINLLSNAIKYTDRGFAELRITYRSQTGFIDVVDSGIGIAGEDQERIFEPFERVAMAETLSRPGIGLGLAITRSLARIMGGELTVESEVGRGSRFMLRLMLPEPADAPPETARSHTILGYKGPRRTILLVDDDPAQLQLLQGLLESIGFNVHAASNGHEGLALAAIQPPEVALLDIQMPEMSGWDVAAGLRSRFRANLKIVMVSANALEFSAGADGQAVHDAFVLKPVDLNLLLDVIATQLGLVWSGRSPAALRVQAEQPSKRLPDKAMPILEELERLAQIGHVRGITEQLGKLAEAVPEEVLLLERLTACVHAFDLKGFIALVEEGRGG